MSKKWKNVLLALLMIAIGFYGDYCNVLCIWWCIVLYQGFYSGKEIRTKSIIQSS